VAGGDVWQPRTRLHAVHPQYLGLGEPPRLAHRAEHAYTAAAPHHRGACVIAARQFAPNKLQGVAKVNFF
jgi:hypothetical protein